MVLHREEPGYRQCTVTVLDNIADPDITFDEQGICNYYYEYQKIALQDLLPEDKRDLALEQLIDSIRKSGKGKPYDCITGVSGGVDSTYLISMAKKWGLRPLIVHFDNGWNTEIAVHNINKVIEKTGFDLYTIVVNWEEFRDLQLAYIKAGVVDLEVPTDHGIAATWYKLSSKYGIKTILSGNNVVTEAILPRSWTYNKSDYVNLLNIHKQFGTVPLKTFPVLGFKEHHIQSLLGGVKAVKPLNFIGYNKQEAKEAIIKEFNWVDYGGKHYESLYTKFYQAYILPHKFKIDKRKPHLSNLILSGQITREHALKELELPLYASDYDLQEEMNYVLKKLGVSSLEFENFMKLPPVPHIHYGKMPFLTQRFPMLKLLKPFARLLTKRN